ncbi:MAG TPA: hypothetical protein DCR93_01980 [Cytophagales bacterium]|nr:hypothetical protein [Cytophagales bacterium]
MMESYTMHVSPYPEELRNAGYEWVGNRGGGPGYRVFETVGPRSAGSFLVWWPIHDEVSFEDWWNDLKASTFWLGNSVPQSLPGLQKGWALSLDSRWHWLPELLNIRPFPVGEGLAIAESLIESLLSLHELGVPHGYLHAGAVGTTGDEWMWLNPGSLPTSLDVTQLTEYWPYMAPEQTPRLGGHTYLQSDIYALGILFHQMLSGELPYNADDFPGWAHLHLAQELPSVHSPHGPVPPAVLAWLRRMTAKDLRERYASLEQVVAHLRMLRAQHAADTLMTFVLPDVQVRLAQGKKQQVFLAGRDEELTALRSGWSQARQGNSSLQIISGPAGIGKTTLVQSLYPEVEATQGLVLTASGDADDPFSSYGLFRSLLQEFSLYGQGLSDQELEALRARLQEGLGPGGHLLVSFVPELSYLVEGQSFAAERDAQSIQNQFRWMVKRFLQKIAGPARPLLLALDNLQWVDVASRELLEELLNFGGLNHTFVVGIYREEGAEVRSEHQTLLQNLQLDAVESVEVGHHALKPLTVPEVRLVLENMLGGKVQDATRVADKLWAKSGGNPMALQTQIYTLVDRGRVVQQEGEIPLKILKGSIQELPASASGSVLLRENLASLSPLSLQLLQTAACMGEELQAAELIGISGVEDHKVAKLLEDSLDAGILLRPKGSESQKYGFVHQSIRGAVLSLMEVDQQARTFLKIGRNRWAEGATAKDEVDFQKIASYFRKGKSALSNSGDYLEAAAVLYRAGEQASGMAGFQAALSHAEEGLALLENCEKIPEDLPLQQELYKLAIANAYHLQEPEVAERWQRQFTAMPINAYEKAWVLAQEMNYLRGIEKYDLSIKKGVQAGRLLGLRYARSHMGNLLWHSIRIKRRLEKYGLDNLPHLPQEEGPTGAALERLTSDLSLSYFQRSPIFGLIATAQIVGRSLKLGINPQSPFTMSAFTLNAVFILRQVQFGQQLDFAMQRLSRQLPEDPWIDAKRETLQLIFVQPWIKPLGQIYPRLVQVGKTLVSLGDFEFGYLNQISSLPAGLLAGVPLTKLGAEVKRMVGIHRDLHRSEKDYYDLMVNALTIGRFSGENTLVCHPDGRPIRMEELEERLVAHESKAGLSRLFWSSQIDAYLRGDAEQARHAIKGWIKHSRYDPTMGNLIYGRFFQILLWAKLPELGSLRKRKQKVSRGLRYLKRQAKSYPDTLSGLVKVVEAEHALLHGRRGQALLCLETALGIFEKVRQLSMIAITHERMGELYHQAELPEKAQRCFTLAQEQYQAWGVVFKVEYLRTEWQVKLPEEETPSPAPEGDAISLLKGLRTITAHNTLAEQGQRMLEVLSETVGAQRALLLLPQPEGWQVLGASDVRQQETDKVASVYPQWTLTFVQRNPVRLLVSSPQAHFTFRRDSYFASHQPQCIWLEPLVRNDKLVALLYLEHYQLAEVFPQEPTEIVSLLLAQMAVTLENRLFFTSMEATVEARTQELQTQHDVVAAQNETLALAQQEQEASLRYAKGIQNMLLSTQAQLHEVFQDSLMLYKPLALVSGDFYWVRQRGDLRLLAVVDCTGHGAPGALMSVIANQQLDEVFQRMKESMSAGQFLQALQHRFSQILAEESSFTANGIDISLVVIDEAAGTLSFAGARQKMLILGEETHVLSGDRLTIEIGNPPMREPFTTHTMPIPAQPVQVYLTSDGFPDQFGGAQNRKYTYKRLWSLLEAHRDRPLPKQQQLLEESLLDWMSVSNEEQVDDILIIGIKLPGRLNQ